MNVRKGVPILEWLPGYHKNLFRRDLIAGFTVAIMLVPQGMAYAMLAGMPPIYGLYGGLVPLILYALFGTSRQLSIGPVAISALLVLAGVSQLAEPGSAEYIRLVTVVGLLVGVLQVLSCALRLGFLVNFLSHPVVAGFTSAAAVIIAISQLKDVLGMSIPRFAHVYETLGYAIRHYGQTNWIVLGLSAGSILLIILLKKISRRIPGALVVVMIGTVLSWIFDFEGRGIPIVGRVPDGLPGLEVPFFSLEDFRLLWPTVLSVTIIGVVESLGIAKMLESKHQSYVVRPNQELLALGLSKLGGAFFQALPTSGSFTRSAINNDNGAQTGMATIITAVVVGLTLLFFTPLFYHLPNAVLAAIILLAVQSLFDWKEMTYLWRTHRQDFAMMMITFIVTLLFGIEEGVFTGVLLSVFGVLYRSSKPHIVEMGNLPGTSYYRNVDRFENAAFTEKVLIIRFDDQLYFGNAAAFKDAVKKKVVDRGAALSHLVLDCSSIHSIDSSGIHALEEMIGFLKKRQICLSLSGVIGPVRDQLHRSGIMERIGSRQQFMKVDDAVRNALAKGPNAHWTEDALQTNWEEE